ncbi:MAG: UPF0182 family membrane protein [Armatimonadota bacterium]
MDFNLNDMPQKPQPRRRWFWWTLLIAFALFFLVSQLSDYVPEWLWFKEMARTDVFLTMFWGRWGLGLLIGILVFGLLFVNIYLALVLTPASAWSDLSGRLREHAFEMLDRTIRRLALWGSIIFSFFIAWGIGSAAAGYWPHFLLFLHPQRLGKADPIFGRDIGFYLFRLPIWELLTQWLFTVLIIALVLTGAVYLFTRAIRTVRGTPILAPAVQAHLSGLLAVIFLVKALQYYLGRFTLLSTPSGGFAGPGYTDVYARIPGLTIMVIVALVAALIVLINIRRRNIALLIGAIIGVIVASVLVLGAYPALVQRFRVAPNQLARETPFIRYNIDATRQAYGLDRVKEVRLSPTPRVTSDVVAASPETTSNIRLWDHRPLLTTFNQQQRLRPYYQFTGVDIDRYIINGQLRQVMLSARELNPDAPQVQQNWVTRHLLYTHGYGLVMVPSNAVDPNNGQPIYSTSDIPPVSTNPALTITQPRIYFGEADKDYVIVRSAQKEFDYPQGDTNVETTYAGSAGILLRNPFVRALMAARFGDINILISSYITAESRILLHRQIVERAQQLAPFLLFDRDPYLVLGNDGRQYWMIDAYTRSNRYPYAQQSGLEVYGGDTARVNYLRNPVKVVVDAYNGTTSFYLIDDKEPFARAWGEVFPGFFKPLSEMPGGLQKHVRFPEGMFNTLSEVYQRYHMTNPTTFFQNEDPWAIPTTESMMDSGARGTTGGMEAYYLVMSLPGQNTPEYLLIRPYTPERQDNMIAWLSARNDPQHLGDLLVYAFPKQSLVYGPAQIEAKINQDPEISQAFTLWGQVGSRILKGNLFVIPLGNTILYVQLIFLQAEQSQIPAIQRIIVADQQRIVMRATLSDALAALTGGAAAPPSAPAPSAQPPSTTAPPTSQPPSTATKASARSALEHYQRAQEALKRGDWATYGKEQEALRRDLETLNRQ